MVHTHRQVGDLFGRLQVSQVGDRAEKSALGAGPAEGAGEQGAEQLDAQPNENKEEAGGARERAHAPVVAPEADYSGESLSQLQCVYDFLVCYRCQVQSVQQSSHVDRELDD